MSIGSWFRRRKPGKNDHSLELARHTGASLLGVTCIGRRDGGGAQIQAAMSAILFSHATGIPYFHTPLQSIEHGNTPETAAVRWEAAFNLGVGAPAVPEGVPVVTGQVFRGGYRGPPAVVAQPFFHAFADRNPNLYREVIDRFRARLALPRRSYASPTIAVHIRRGDIVGKQSLSWRLTEDAAVARYIRTAMRDFPGHRVRVFSEGLETDFRALPDVREFELNSDVLETISGMIEADCLIMAKSSLSYVAGLLSRGVVYYEPFWHKPLSSWRVLR